MTPIRTQWQTNNDLGEAALKEGRYAEAKKHFLTALEEAETFGPQDTRLALSLNNLATLYYLEGNYSQAEPLFKRALPIYERALGPEHLAVTNSLNNLAGLYFSQSDYAQADPLLKRALAIREQALGPDHPDVADVLSNLAGFYCAQENYAQAVPLFKRALTICESALGPNHPDVIVYRENYNTVLEIARQQ